MTFKQFLLKTFLAVALILAGGLLTLVPFRPLLIIGIALVVAGLLYLLYVFYKKDVI